MQVTGKAIIRVDGTELRTQDGATLNPGGEKREAQVGNGKVHGYKEETQAPELECQVFHTADLSLKALGAITSATVMFETDTGAVFVLREAFVTDVPSLNVKDGTVGLKMSAISCDEGA
ncbi:MULTISPECIES: phage tail tube protein [Pseudodesulfovibrio]|uniref:Tail tube protein, bacteriophage n=1 Tax=Pseudodesulfovibrio aespoeensis (strain ATCC 700646 / DSM 10631 / Aspo-2) TaxID=643562 RepID=E6VU93_PSEA9|nr:MULTISPECIES: phage tail tube protein [Pseudodesulfovibrio]ADU63400.1 Tail tube protein, bacteriophage [Pseudodesulfovibrio aespoeensis Aspo-2]MCG2732520.1 phage tail tube protein [Pseudodesulfovibrio aespoeensis]